MIPNPPSPAARLRQELVDTLPLWLGCVLAIVLLVAFWLYSGTHAPW